MNEPYEHIIDAPKSLKYLIQANDTILKKHKAELMQQVYEASIDFMTSANLYPEDGWRFDVDNFRFVKMSEQTRDASVAE